MNNEKKQVESILANMQTYAQTNNCTFRRGDFSSLTAIYFDECGHTLNFLIDWTAENFSHPIHELTKTAIVLPFSELIKWQSNFLDSVFIVDGLNTSRVNELNARLKKHCGLENAVLKIDRKNNEYDIAFNSNVLDVAIQTADRKKRVDWLDFIEEIINWKLNYKLCCFERCDVTTWNESFPLQEIADTRKFDIVWLSLERV